MTKPSATFRATVLAVATITTAFATAEAEWELKKEEDGIRVLTRAVDGSRFKAVRATMTVSADIATLVALVRDTEACAEWAHLCKSSSEHDVIRETELYVYTHNDLPWPVSDRDALAHVTWAKDPATGTVTMTARAVGESDIKKKRGVVRLKDALTSWTFRPTEDGVEVISDAHVDPGGPLSAWITNMLLVDAPFQTMTRMRSLADTGRYDGASFAFLD